MPDRAPDNAPPRPLVIDAMNVIGSRPNGWWRNRPGAIRDLVAKLRRFADQQGAVVTVVIDGRPLPQPAEGRRGRLEVRYARRSGPDAADDRIVELVEALDGRAHVVTADRGLRERVEGRGATTMGPRQLLRELDDAEAGQHVGASAGADTLGRDRTGLDAGQGQGQGQHSMNLGGMEIAALAVLALLIFGPERLPEIARNVGKTIAAVRREARSTVQSLSDEADLAEFKNLARDFRSEADELRSAASLRSTNASQAGAKRRPGDFIPFDPDAT